MKYLVYCILFTLAVVVGCGQQPSPSTKANNPPIASRNLNTTPTTPSKPNTFATAFRGQWTAASNINGKLTANLCSKLVADSGADRLTITETGYTLVSTTYLGSTDCTGTDTVTITENFKAAKIASSGSEQTFKVVDYNVSIAIKGQKTVAALQKDKACDKDKWEEKTYTQNDAQLQECYGGIIDNTGSYLFEIPLIEDFKDLKYRFQVSGQGVAFSLLDEFPTASGKYEHQGFFARLPAGKK